MLKTFSEGISTGEEHFATLASKKSALESPAGKKLAQEYTKELMRFGIKQEKAKKLVDNLLRGQTLSGDILRGGTAQQIKTLKKIFRAQQSAKIKSTAAKLIKHLATKEGLKLSAKMLARAVSWFTRVSFPALWAMDFVDMATSPEVKRRYKELGEMAWWKKYRKEEAEKIKRDLKARLKYKTGGKVFSEPNPSIPQGEYYHKDKGWY